MQLNRCCICGEAINGRGNNAAPLAEGRCCDRCNIKVVVERWKAVMKERKELGEALAGAGEG